MSITKTFMTVECDHPDCEDTITLQYGLNAEHSSISGAMRARGWQPYGQADYCPAHRKEQ